MTVSEQAITAFLSHASADAEAGWIDPLEQELQLRGLEVWRDKHQLLAGHHNWEEVRRGIETCTVFVVVITPRSLERAAVWDELRYADKRWEKHREFPMIPVRIGVSRDELNRDCRLKGVHPLGDQQDIGVSDDPAWTPEADPGWVAGAAGKILASAIDRHLRLTDRALVVTLRTRAERTILVPDLDLDWSACFDPEPDAATWRRLLTALEDLADAVKKQTRQERFSVQLLARLGVGVALGWAVPRTSARKIDIVNPDARGTWPSDAAEIEDGSTGYIEAEDAQGNDSVGTVLLSVGRDAHAMYARSPDIERAGPLLAVNRREETPLTAETGAAAALHIGRTIRHWCDTRGLSKVQIVGAMPIGLAVLIGRQLNATVDVVVFHDRAGVYVQACYLPGGSKGAGPTGAGVTT